MTQSIQCLLHKNKYLTSEPQNFVIPVLARRQVTPRVSSLAAQSSKISERLGSVRDLASKIRQRMTEEHT